MKKTPHKTQPGEFDIRIRPDGSLYVYAADETMLDVVEAVAPDHPSVVLRRKARSNARSRDDQAGGRPAAGGK